jgi:hypothetical protein
MVEPALLDTPLTFFSRFGDGPTALLLALASMAMLRRARRSQPAQGPGAEDKMKKAPSPV